MSLPRLNQLGQTMVDLIVALALLSLAASSSGLLATVSARVNIEAGQRSQAVALAERELEGLRDYRNSQEAAGTAWADMWPTANCSSFIMQRTGDTWQPDTNYTSLTSYSTPDSDSDPTLATTYSGFSRVDTICSMQETVPGSAPQQVVSNLKQVTVTVQWATGNGSRQVILRTILADWSE